MNAKGIVVTSANLPCDKSVRIYHNTLMSDKDITCRVGKAKGKNRDMNDVSVPNMLSNIAGFLLHPLLLLHPKNFLNSSDFKKRMHQKVFYFHGN